MKPGRFWDTVRGALHLTHPFPMVMNAIPAGSFMLVASPDGDLVRVAGLVLSVAAIHGAIGSLNDYCDYPLDKVAKPSKPLVRGLVTRRYARLQAMVLAAGGLLLAMALGWLSLFFAVLVLLAGFWYDLWAKGTLMSWVPYAVFIPSLPLWGFAAADRFDPVLLLAYPLGALLSLGLNVTNTLPDLEQDAAHGVRGLVHRLGRNAALLVAWGSFAGAMLGLAAAAPVVRNDWRTLAPGLAAGALLLLAMIGDYTIFRSPRSLKRTWYASAVLSAILGLAWVASLP